MARLGVPVGGRVRKLRAVDDQSAPIPKERMSESGMQWRPSGVGLDQCSIRPTHSAFRGGARHCVVPTAKVLEVRELRFSAEQIVLDYTVEIVVDEQGSIGNQERRLGQHIVDRRQ